MTNPLAVFGNIPVHTSAVASLFPGLKAGNQKVFGFLVGQAMKALKGKADPKKINELLRKALGE